MKKLLKNKYALMLWGSRSFSRFGDALETLALMYLVYDLTGSGLAMGSMLVFSVLPNVIVSPFAGVIADRYNKNKIMFFTELVRTICILIIPLLMITKTIALWHIYAISVVVSIAESFFEPTAGTTFVLVVGKEDMPVYNSAITISNHVLRILGYSLSGIIMAAMGKEILFIIDAVTFFASAIVSLIVKIPKVELSQIEENHNFKEQLLSGFKYVLHNKIILTIFFVIIMIQFLGTPLETYIPIVIDRILKVTTSWSGYFYTASIAGAIIGNILYPILKKTSLKLENLYLISISILGLTIGVGAFLLNPFYYSFMYFVVGVVGSTLGTWSFTEVQILTDTAYLGRVGSIATMIMLISPPLAGVVFGGLADIITIPVIYKYVAVLWFVIAVISYISTKKTYKSFTSQSQLNNVEGA